MTRKKRTTYTDKFRASAVLMLEAAGYPHKKGALVAVSRNVGVPSMTISRWFKSAQNPPPNEMVSEKRIDFVEALEKEIGLALNEMENARDSASYKDLTTAVGIMIDKRQLLTGAPTEQNETKIFIKYDDDNARTP